MPSVRSTRPAPSEVFDRVLGKGIVVTTTPDAEEESRTNVSIAGIGAIDVRSRVVVADAGAETDWKRPTAER